MADPVQLLAGPKALALSQILGVEVAEDSIITVMPQLTTAQWFVDNPAPDDATAPIWWSLTSPDRRPLTSALMREAIVELQTVIDALKVRFKAERAEALRTKRAAMNQLTTMPDIAGQIRTAENIRGTLQRTRADLERIHYDLSRRYDHQN